MKEYAIKAKDAGERLDVVLTRVAKLARSKAAAAVKEGHALLNGKPATPHDRVKEGDRVTLDLPKKTREKKLPIPPLTVLYEDDEVLVVDKQAGIAVHPAPGVKGMTLLDAIVEHAPKVKDAGGEANRPGIVHRLDKGVSGVMIVAKTPKAFEFLKTQFKDRLAEKHYQALVYGLLPRDHETIDLPISRSKNLGRMVARAKGEEGKDAITDYDVIARYKNTTLVRVHPKTGRTHQIRVHFKAIDHPVVGDTLYVKRYMRHIRPIKMDRVFLHAETLTIALPSGETKTFSAPLPAALEDMLKKLPTV